MNAISTVPGVIKFRKPEVDYNDMGLRIGFAEGTAGTGKTAIRGGFGISYGVKFQNFVSITLPPQLQSELNESSACTLTPLPSWCPGFLANGGNGGPGTSGFLSGGGLPQTYIPPAGQAGARALTTSFIDDTVSPKILTWSLGVQHEVYRNATVEVRYLGTRGLLLPVQFRRNRISGFDGGRTALPPFFGAPSLPAAFTASAPTSAPLDTFNNNIYSPFPFIPNITSDPPIGSSIYHAGSVNLLQRSR